MPAKSEQSQAQATAGLSSRAWCVAFVAVAVAALLPRGSVSLESAHVFTSLMSIVAIAAATQARARQRTDMVFRIALAILVAMALMIVLQSSRLPWTGLSNPAWPEANAVSGRSGATISVAPADTMSALVSLAGPFITFMAGLLLCHSDERAETMFRRLAIATGFVAAFSLAQHFAFPRYLLLAEKQFYLGQFTAVFVNRNTAATFLGLATILLTGLLWKSAQEGAPAGLLTRLIDGKAVRGRRGTGQFVLLLGLAATAFIGLTLTQSRAGIASSLIALLFLLTYLAATGQDLARYRFSAQNRRRGSRLVAIIVAIAGLVAIGLTFAGQTMLRTELSGLDDDRFCTATAIVDALSDYPVAGMGFGTFEAGFPAYRRAECSIRGVWDRAHNFYLEGQLGLGMIFPIGLILAVGVLFKSFVTGLRERRKARIYPAMGIAILILALLHSAFDFSLQLPGLSIFLAAVLAPLVSISLGRPRRSGALD
ncbi:MAG: O-antigen ligase family protein [Rhizobium sp.]|nr:O-antigen ligase family protein [Rhizobium sp.]